MTLRELIGACRRRSGDLRSNPPLWSDAEWTEYINEAVYEACIRGKLIDDDSLTADVWALDAYISIPSRAFSVRRVAIGGRALELTTWDDLDATLASEWEAATGAPIAAYRVGPRLRLYPIPVADAEATLTAFCTAENELVGDDDTPEIAPGLHMNLVDWALRCAYSRPDADGFDGIRASGHEARFEAKFGPRPDAIALRRTSLKVRRVARGNFF